MTDRRSDNFESSLRRHRIEPPPPALRQAALASAAEEPLFRREPAARWDRLVPAAAVFVILFSIAVCFSVGPVAPKSSSSAPAMAAQPPVDPQLDALAGSWLRSRPSFSTECGHPFHFQNRDLLEAMPGS